VHRINSPKKGIWKVYEAELSKPLEGKDAEAAAKKFASGLMLLTGDMIPLLPAKLTMVTPTKAQVAICEGRYHQARVPGM
jgi:16S rRNA pseudouridine516 synthase